MGWGYHDIPCWGWIRREIITDNRNIDLRRNRRKSMDILVMV